MPINHRGRLYVGSVLSILIAIALVILELAALLQGVVTPLQTLELSARDFAIRLRGARAPANPIAIVAIDDFSFNWTGYQWPWPRSYLARIVDRLNQDGARVIGLDVLLLEKSADEQGDQALAAALARATSSVMVMQIFREQASPAITLKLPLPIYRDASKGLGITEIAGDVDPIVRSLGAFNAYGANTYYNWAFEIARQYLGVSAPSNPADSSLSFNGKRVPLVRGRLLIDYDGPAGTVPTYSAARLVEGDYPPETFAGKVVLIGATTATLQDLYPTPFSTAVRTPGVEIVANAVDTIMSSRYLSEAPPLSGVLLIILAAVAAWFVARRGEPIRAIAWLIAGMALIAALWFVVFATTRLYSSLVGPELMFFLGIVLPTVESSVTQEREKRRVRSMFGRFVAPEIVDQIMQTTDIGNLNRRAELTILFSDIRGFTTLSEKMTPEQVVALLNPYLEAMTKVIYKHGGTVDKFEGDAIMAFYGQPIALADHALRAVATAVEMSHVLAEMNRNWKESGQLSRKIEIGIGLNTGPVFVGMLGSAQRTNYTVIGDAANLASRLQDQTKEFKWPILISGETYELVKEQFDAEFADSRLVKGKTEPVDIYRVLGAKGAPEAERVRALFLDD